MADLTSIIRPAEDSDIDPVNTFQIILGTLLSGVALGIFGINTGNIELAIIGLTFFSLSILGIIFVQFSGRGSLFTSDATLTQSAFAVWAPILLFNFSSISRFLTSQLAFATPDKTYAASALSGVPSSVVTITVNWFAPGAENIALLGIGTALVLFTTQQFGENLPATALGLIPIGLIFAGLHSQQLANPAFLLTAFSLMFVWGLYLFATDLGQELPLSQALPVTFGLFYGIHRGINHAASGGLIASYSSILTAPSPIIFVSIILIILDIITLLLAGLFVVEQVQRFL